MADKVVIYHALDPAREKAIRILETIVEMLGTPDMFDCQEGDLKWYDFEDMVTKIIAEEEK